MDQYRAWLSQNASQISSIESTLKSLSYFVPGKFKDAEVASESRKQLTLLNKDELFSLVVHSLVSIISLFHDSILNGVVDSLPRSLKPHASPHTRYTKYWLRNRRYRALALAIVVVKQTELLLEMLSKKRYGEKGQWRCVVGIEGFKALCKILIMKITNNRLVPEALTNDRDLDPEVLDSPQFVQHLQRNLGRSDSEKKRHTQMNGYANGHINGNGHVNVGPTDNSMEWQLPRTGNGMEAMPFGGRRQVNNYLNGKVLSSDKIQSAKDLARPLNSWGQAAELLHILRPLIYALALRKWGAKKWKPWMIGILIDFASRSITKYMIQSSGTIPGGFWGLTQLERQEYVQRFNRYIWWIMRSPAYEMTVRIILNGFCSSIENRTILGLLAILIRDYQYLFENFYFAREWSPF